MEKIHSCSGLAVQYHLKNKCINLEKLQSMIKKFQIIRKNRVDEIYRKFKLDTFEKIILAFDIVQNYILTKLLDLIEVFPVLKIKDELVNNLLECFTK
jgi:hypothetical protein